MKPMTVKMAAQFVEQCKSISKVHKKLNQYRRELLEHVRLKGRYGTNEVYKQHLVLMASNIYQCKQQIKELNRGLAYITGTLTITPGVKFQAADAPLKKGYK